MIMEELSAVSFGNKCNSRADIQQNTTAVNQHIKINTQLNMANKRDSKVEINEIAISKVPHIACPGIDEDSQTKLTALVQEVLRVSMSKNKHNEVAIVCDINNPDVDDPIIIYGDEHSVDVLQSGRARDLINKNECVVALLHNHPSTSLISLNDIFFLLRFASIKMMLVVSNKGAVTYIMKKPNYNKDKAVSLYKEAVSIDRSSKDLSGRQRATKHFLYNSSNCGLLYKPY